MNKYDYSRLRGRITEKTGNINNFIDKMQISTPALYNKLNNRTEFKQTEIQKACEILEIPKYEIYDYFFIQIS